MLPRILIPLLAAVIVALSVPVLAGETVTRVIEADVPMVIDGQWLYSPFTVVLTDSNVTVNGVTYVKPWHEKKPVPIPSREESYIDWLLRTVTKKSGEMLAEGVDFDTIKAYMTDWFEKNADPDSVEVEYLADCFRVVHEGCEMWVPITGSIPEPLPPTRVWKYEPRFEEVCHMLSLGYFILHSTEKGIPRPAFPTANYPGLVEKLKRLAQSDEPLPRSITITNKYGQSSELNPVIIEKMRQVRREREMMQR